MSGVSLIVPVRLTHLVKFAFVADTGRDEQSGIPTDPQRPACVLARQGGTSGTERAAAARVLPGGEDRRGPVLLLASRPGGGCRRGAFCTGAPCGAPGGTTRRRSGVGGDARLAAADSARRGRRGAARRPGRVGGAGVIGLPAAVRVYLYTAPCACGAASTDYR